MQAYKSCDLDSQETEPPSQPRAIIEYKCILVKRTNKVLEDSSVPDDNRSIQYNKTTAMTGLPPLHLYPEIKDMSYLTIIIIWLEVNNGLQKFTNTYSTLTD